jgi:hypothetical protein
MQECGVMTNVPFAGVVDFVNKYGFTMAGDLEVVWLVTLDEPHGFYYLTDTETGRFTMEHDDAWPFYSEAAADAVAVQFAVKGAKAGVLCSAMRRRVPQLIGEASLPAEFRSDNMFGGTEAEFKARTVAFRAYCKANSIFYYGRPRESFSSWEAFQLCKAAGCAKLLLDDLS